MKTPLIPESDLKRSVLTNTLAQVVGRNLIALARLAIAAVVVRAFGRSVFGEYSIIFGILSIGEWLLDFGTTETFVREICREPGSQERLLRIVTRAKFWQVPAACAAIAVILLCLRYPAPVLEAGLIGAGSLVFFGGVLVYRVVFKTTLTMERELAAELLSVILTVPLVALVGWFHGSLSALLACHVVSRMMFCALCSAFGRARFRLSAAETTRGDAAWALRASAAIGVIGLLVAVYEAMDVLILSKFGALSDVAYYSAAQRLIWPMLIGLSSIGSTLYPIAASYWQRDREKFEQACQRGVDTVVAMAGLAICAIAAGAEFFIGLLGPDLVRGAAALEILAVLCFFKSITSTVGPLLYVVRAQKQTLQVVCAAVALKAAALALLAPRFGYRGVAFGALAVEICCSVIPVVALFHWASGMRLSWIVPVKTLAVIVAAALASRALMRDNHFGAALLGPALYLPLIFATGAASFSEIQSLMRLKWRTA